MPTLVGYTLKRLLLILFAIPLTGISQQCYELNNGKGLSLFSPFFRSSPRVVKQNAQFFFGDSSRSFLCNGIKRKSVLGVYEIPNEEPVFAAHSGTVSIYTSMNANEGNQANDALWIDGGNITTNYIGLIPTVQTGQYVYSGQQLGRIYRDKFASIFGFGIRLNVALNPIHKRGYLPTISEKRGSCECNTEPVWPEYFVNPASIFIAYDRFNEFMPEASLRVNIEPGGIGAWSFDNGATWLTGGEKISALPFGYYKIIFKNDYGYFTPAAIRVRLTSKNKEYQNLVTYTPDYTILKRPAADLQREADQEKIDGKLIWAMDSINRFVLADDKSASIKSSIIDSLNKRFSRIEAIQKETFFFTKLFKYILPILLIAVLFTIILLFQNNKIRRQKRYLENLQKEQHHRVHNSLGLVSSLLNKYKNNINPEKLANIDNSIIAISTVHRQLYKGNDLEYIDFQPIVEQISKSLLAQKELSNTINIIIDALVAIPQKKSTTLALMFTELFTNSLKYAFDDNENSEISFIVTKQGSQITALYHDNGKGYTTDFLKQKTTGFGRVLLAGLAHQLKAKITFYNNNGACCLIKI